MTIQSSEIAELKLRVAELEKRVAQLQAQLANRGDRVLREAPVVTARPRTRKEIRTELLARGIVRLPSSEEMAIASRWQSRSEKERARIVAKLERLRLDPPLSDIIHQMRSDEYPGNIEAEAQPK